jgi:hypothetical protein
MARTGPREVVVRRLTPRERALLVVAVRFLAVTPAGLVPRACLAGFEDQRGLLASADEIEALAADLVDGGAALVLAIERAAVAS